MNRLVLSLALLSTSLLAAPPTSHKDCCKGTAQPCCKETCCKASDHCCKGAEHKDCAKDCDAKPAPKG